MREDAEGQTALVLDHVTVIDTAGGPSRPDTGVFIASGRITGIKKAGSVRPPEGTQVIDATGKYLIPGLWDMHTHLGDERHFPLCIANGVTGVRILWGFFTHHAWREQISSGSLLGPRLVIASPLIDGPKPFWPGSISVSSEAEARQAVRQAKEDGADFIKVYELLPRQAFLAIADESRKIGIPFAGHIPWSVSVTEAADAGLGCIEHLGAGVTPRIVWDCSSRKEELRKEGERAHADISIQRPLTPSQTEALRSFPKKILETYDAQEATTLFSRLVRNNTWVCPTLTVLRSMRSLNDVSFTNDPRLKFMRKGTREHWDAKDNPFVSGWTEEYRATEKEVHQKELESVGAMHRAGVELLAGTDEPNPFCFPGFSLHDELDLLVQAGLKPMEALQAATYKPAEFLGQLDSLGTVEADKVADLVLLEANPLEDIGNTRRIAAVVVGGRYYPRTALDGMLAKAEALARQDSIAEVLLKTIAEKEIGSAILQYRELKATRSDSYDFRENELNSLGYRLLARKKVKEAVEVLKLNVEAYPQSANAYDSLGEAYMVSGDAELAIRNCEKSLELDPGNSSAAQRLKKLRSE